LECWEVDGFRLSIAERVAKKIAAASAGNHGQILVCGSALAQRDINGAIRLAGERERSRPRLASATRFFSAYLPLLLNGQHGQKQKVFGRQKKRCCDQERIVSSIGLWGEIAERVSDFIRRANQE